MRGGLSRPFHLFSSWCVRVKITIAAANRGERRAGLEVMSGWVEVASLGLRSAGRLSPVDRCTNFGKGSGVG